MKLYERNVMIVHIAAEMQGAIIMVQVHIRGLSVVWVSHLIQQRQSGILRVFFSGTLCVTQPRPT